MESLKKYNMFFFGAAPYDMDAPFTQQIMRAKFWKLLCFGGFRGGYILVIFFFCSYFLIAGDFDFAGKDLSLNWN